MSKRAATFLFITVIIISYVILAFELVAMQNVIKYLELDNNFSPLISMIGFIVIFLALGYYTSDGIDLKNVSIRNKIINNFFISILFIFLGNSHFMLDKYFETLNYWDINGKMIQTYIFTNIFLSTPTYLLAQSVPLIGKYFEKKIIIENRSNIILFAIVLSFILSLIITLFFSCTFGLDYAVIFNIFLMTVGILILNKREKAGTCVMCLCLLAMTFTFNNRLIRNKISINRKNNEYISIKYID